jgi:glucosylceramidase
MKIYNPVPSLNNPDLTKWFGIILLLVFSGIIYSCKESENVNDPLRDSVKVQFWLTDPAQDILFTQQPDIITTTPSSAVQTISVSPGELFQEMDGFGYALTGGSALHINNMSAAARQQLLTELFDHDEKNIGVSYLRISIGSSDLDPAVFSYNDLPFGETDVNMEKFSLDKDREYLIPVLKEILKINPEIKILGSPWSAPVWMKTNRNSIGGSLKPEYFDAYAKYFIKYVQEMAAEGIIIDAITVQNEPLHPGNNPSMYMTPEDQAKFIKNNLGPAFRDAGINTKIIIYDHNADRIDYPMTVLNDPEAKKYIDGSAFHLYGGQISALSTLYYAHPDKKLYFTEQWVGAPGNLPDDLRWHTRELIVGAVRNWCRTVIEWNLAADENQDPHTPGGCDRCLGAVTIKGDQVIHNPAYYIIAHASKFVRPGSVRIGSDIPSDFPNVAFKTPDGKIVVIVLNNSDEPKTFNLSVGEKTIRASLSAGAVGTFIW